MASSPSTKRRRSDADTVNVQVRVPRTLDEMIETTSEEVNLSKPDTIRLSLERGLKVLKKQLGMPVEA